MGVGAEKSLSIRGLGFGSRTSLTPPLLLHASTLTAPTLMDNATCVGGMQAIAQLRPSVVNTTLTSLMQAECVARVEVAQQLKSAFRFQKCPARILTTTQLILSGMDAAGTILRKRPLSVVHSIQMRSVLMRCAVAVVEVVIRSKE